MIEPDDSYLTAEKARSLRSQNAHNREQWDIERTSQLLKLTEKFIIREATKGYNSTTITLDSTDDCNSAVFLRLVDMLRGRKFDVSVINLGSFKISW